MSDAATPDISGLTFEQALAELERIVDALEKGQAGLEESIDIYKRGADLKAHCEAKLQAARLRVEKITLSGGAPTGAEPAEFS